MVWKLRVVRWKEDKINCKEKKNWAWLSMSDGTPRQELSKLFASPARKVAQSNLSPEGNREGQGGSKFQANRNDLKQTTIDNSPYRTDDEKLISFFFNL